VDSSERHYSIALRDGNFYNYGYIGSRTTGTEAGDYMVIGPDGMAKSKKVFRSSTQFSIALYRTQLFNPDDIQNVRKVQAEYKLETLSKYKRQPPPPPAPIIKFQWIGKKHLMKNFFQHPAFALRFAPTQSIEADAHANLAKLGVGPRRTFNFRDLSQALVGKATGCRTQTGRCSWRCGCTAENRTAFDPIGNGTWQPPVVERVS
jgi:hypothetical protein